MQKKDKTQPSRKEINHCLAQDKDSNESWPLSPIIISPANNTFSHRLKINFLKKGVESLEIKYWRKSDSLKQNTTTSQLKHIFCACKDTKNTLCNRTSKHIYKWSHTNKRSHQQTHLPTKSFLQTIINIIILGVLRTNIRKN